MNRFVKTTSWLVGTPSVSIKNFSVMERKTAMMGQMKMLVVSTDIK